MKLDTSKITDGVAVKLDGKTPDERINQQNRLTEAFNLRGRACYGGWGYWWLQDNAFLNGGWNSGTESAMLDYCDTIIPFEDLIIPEESNLIKALHAVGVGDWLKEGVEFEWRDRIYQIVDGDLNVRSRDSGWDGSIAFEDMIKHPDLIKPLPRWTPEEQKMAEKDSFRFGWVARDSRGTIELYTIKPGWDENIKWFYTEGETMPIPETDYPSLQPGECVSLEEIVRGCE